MPRPLSDSWQYFTLLETQTGKTKKARCTFCGLEKAASITRLHQHLLFRCSRIDLTVREQLRQKAEEDQSEEQPRQQQAPIEPKPLYYPQQSSSPTEVPQDQAMLDWYLARALFSSNVPFETIENPHMIEFFRHLQPNYTVPDSRRLKQYLLKEQHWDLINRQNEPPHSIMDRHNRINGQATRMSPEDLEGNL